MSPRSRSALIRNWPFAWRAYQIDERAKAITLECPHADPWTVRRIATGYTDEYIRMHGVPTP